MLSALTNAAILKCSFDDSVQPGCGIFTLSSIAKSNEEIEIQNSPFSPYTDNTTTKLYLNAESYQRIDIGQEFPKNIFKIFLNIFEFDIKDIATKSLGTESFYNCGNLKSISISDSNVSRIGARVAKDCINVLLFSVECSNLKSINRNAFEGLYNLEILSLSNNTLTCLHSKLFQPLKSLDRILLANNQITALHSQLFVGLPMLTDVYARFNQIKYIPNFNLASTGVRGNYLDIDLDLNPIQAVHPDLIKNIFESKRNNSPISINFLSIDMQTCIPQSITKDINSINLNLNWKSLDKFFGFNTTCYSSFTDKMEDDSLAVCKNSVAVLGDN